VAENRAAKRAGGAAGARKARAKEGTVRGVTPEIMEALRGKLETHEFASAQMARR